ncbi:MAG: antibiotic ABC transporter permease, partial [Clostridia bacterium]|nr:antibiotic ABC transporter permease [Clostridia bacterium]
MKKFGMFIAKKRIAILIIATLLLIPAVYGFIHTKVNYDILTYLPGGIDSVEGEKVLDKDFSDAATGMLVINGMSDQDIQKTKKQIESVTGVERVVWKDDITDITVPDNILPERLSSVFTKGSSTLMLIQFKSSASSEATQQAIGAIRTKLNAQCFLSGTSALVK